MHSKPLRILLTNSTDIYAGGEFFVYSLAKELQGRGHHVFVVCKTANRLKTKCEQDGIPVLPVDFPAQGQLLQHIEILRRRVRDHAIDLVHTNTNYDRTAGAFAAWREDIPHVTNVHSFHSLQHNVTHWIRNRWATDHFIVDGVCVKDMLVEENDIPPSKISVVHLGVNPDEMKRDEQARRIVRESFGYTDNTIVIGNVARLVPFKGHENLLRAFVPCASQFPDTRLLLVGDGELHTHLTDLAASLGIEDRVTFAGFRDDLQAVYSAFDMYVHPSIEGGGETFPFAVLQALSQELPVVVTRVGDVAEMVVEGSNGFVVPDRDVGALAGTMNVLLHDGALRCAMGRRGREYLLGRFTIPRMVDVLVTLYGTVLDSR